jgi:hypothetical protein
LQSTQHNKILVLIFFSGLIALPIVLMLLSADFFDKGPSLCLSVVLLNKTCYGCGITRAIQHLLHFELSKALAYNKLCVIVLPFLIFIWGQTVLKTYRKLKAL